MKFSVYFILNESQFSAKYSMVKVKCSGTKIKLYLMGKYFTLLQF